MLSTTVERVVIITYTNLLWSNILQKNHFQIKSLCDELEASYSEVSSAAEARAARLEAALKAQQFLHDALEVDSWLADKAAALASADVGTDRHRATQLLTRHKVRFACKQLL